MIEKNGELMYEFIFYKFINFVHVILFFFMVLYYYYIFNLNIFL